MRLWEIFPNPGAGGPGSSGPTENEVRQALSLLEADGEPRHERMAQNMRDNEHRVCGGCWREISRMIDVFVAVKELERALMGFARERIAALVRNARNPATPCCGCRDEPADRLISINAKLVGRVTSKAHLARELGKHTASLEDLLESLSEGVPLVLEWMWWCTFSPSSDDDPFLEIDTLAASKGGRKVEWTVGCLALDLNGSENDNLLRLTYGLPDRQAWFPTVLNAAAGKRWNGRFRPAKAGQPYGLTDPDVPYHRVPEAVHHVDFPADDAHLPEGFKADVEELGVLAVPG